MTTNTPQSAIQTGSNKLPESQASGGLQRRPDGMSDAEWQQQQEAQAGAGGVGGLQSEKAPASGDKDTPSNT